MVFVSAFPTDQGDYAHLEDSINQITLNDRTVSVMKESSDALGAGWRLGFLGTLHCSVFEDRLRQEHEASIIITPPSVPFRIVKKDGTSSIITNPNLFPETLEIHQNVAQIEEPYITATITLPEEYLGKVIELCEANRGEQTSLSFFTATQVILKYLLPLERLVDDFFGRLKSTTKGKYRLSSRLRHILTLSSFRSRLCLARLRRRRLPALFSYKATTTRQQGPSRCRGACDSHLASRAPRQGMGDQVQGVRGSADVRGGDPGGGGEENRSTCDPAGRFPLVSPYQRHGDIV